MKTTNTIFALLLVSITLSCNRVQPNYEGVLMTNYGRNGKADFKVQTGNAGFLWVGQELYQVPMFEQNSDPDKVSITTQDAGVFTVDPSYTYQAIRGHGVDIVFSYKHLLNSGDQLDNVEVNVLNKLAINAYREIAREFTTDSLMTHMNNYELAVENKLKTEFQAKFFQINNLTSGLTPPQSMSEAIEKRNNTKQRAEQVKNELEVEEMELKKAEIRRQRDLVQSAGLTKEILQQQFIEALRTTQNKVIITDGRTPVILNQ